MNDDLEYTNCLICKTDKTYKITEFKFPDLKSHLVICKSCGLSYLNPRWNKEKYIEYYKDNYDSEYRSELKRETLNQEINLNNIIIDRFRKANISIDGAKNILDIGSGSGENIYAFKKLKPGLDCYAIEPSKLSHRFLADRNINLISVDVDSDWHLKYEKQFDVIIMRHVLEHFLNPIEILKKVNSVLSENGVLYIAVPNNLLEKRQEGWLRLAHTYYFNKYTLKHVLNMAGLYVQRLYLEDQHNKYEVFGFAQKNNGTLLNEGIVNSFEIQKRMFRCSLDNHSLIEKIKIVINRKLKRFLS